MPEAITTAFMHKLFQLFEASGVTLYMGLSNSGSEVAGGGYARQAIPVSTLTDAAGSGGQVLTIPQVNFPPFTSAPITQNRANEWDLWTAATGGTKYASGPLNPAAVASTLSAAAASGATSILVPTSAAASLAAEDTLAFGSLCAGNLEYEGVISIGSASGGNTTVNIGALSHAHPSGEAWSRDGATRIYQAGYPETVQASILMLQE